MTSSFRHQETERTIAFGRGAIDSSLDLFGDGFTLLTTEQASKAAPAVTALANEVITVPPGLVEEIAEVLRPLPVDRGLVALGGGRVIDVAKALAAADRLSGLVAIPTTLSGAEMTGRHRQIAGIPANTPYVRPTVVINDPSLSASQAVPDLAASSANALGHAITAVLSDRSTPFARAVGSEALRSICSGWSGSEPDRDSLALGALLAGWAVDKSGLGLHHAMAQTAVRAASIGHAEANAALLPATIAPSGDVVRRNFPTLISYSASNSKCWQRDSPSKPAALALAPSERTQHCVTRLLKQFSLGLRSGLSPPPQIALSSLRSTSQPQVDASVKHQCDSSCARMTG